MWPDMFMRRRKLEWLRLFVRGREETQADELIRIHSGEKASSCFFCLWDTKCFFFPLCFIENIPVCESVSPPPTAQSESTFGLWDSPFNRIIHPAKHTCHASLIFIVRPLLLLQQNAVLIPLQRQKPQLWPRKMCVPVQQR